MANPPTGLDVISSALRLIGVLASGEQPQGAEQSDALDTLNSMIDSWNAERLMIYTVPRLLFNLNSGQQSYLYGLPTPTVPTPDFNSARPAKIERIDIIWLANPAQPLELPLQYLTVEQWADIPVKNISSALPQYCWDDNGFPLRTLNFWPIPNNIQLQVAIYPWNAIQEPVTLTTQLAFPPGYWKAFRYSLAVELAAEYPVVPPQIVAGIAAMAQEAKRLVKVINTPILDLGCDPAVTPASENSLYNWISDGPATR